MRSLAQVVAELRDEPVPDAPPVARDVRQPAAVLARRGPDGGGRPRRPGRAWTTPATPSRSPPPAATTCCSRAQGLGQDQLAERIPGHPARPDPRGGARAHRGALAGRGARARRRAADPAAVRRAPPRRQHGQPGRRRHRAGAARRDQPGPLRGAAPGRVPAVPRRRHRRAAPAAGERRHQRRPRRGVRRAPGPRHRRPRGQPVPVRQLPSRRRLSRCTCREVQRRDYRRKVTGPIIDRIDITRHLAAPHADGQARPVRGRRVDRRGPGAGRGGAGAAGRPLRRRAAGGSTARCPARRCGALAADRPRPPSSSTTSSGTGGSPAAGSPACTGWRGRSPTSPASTGPGSRRPRSRCACAPASPCCASTVRRAAG